ncbi:MAG TPA: response regulator [Burkholderiaceae bacterium]|nr:response regulator [Burkholderiaceae bacterium]
MARLLQLSGHSVQTAHDGLRALALAASMRPDVVLMDIGLPEMDGYEVARRIRELPGLGDVRLIAVTGYGQESDKLAALSAGFQLHLVKPVDPDELARVIAG